MLSRVSCDHPWLCFVVSFLVSCGYPGLFSEFEGLFCEFLIFLAFLWFYFVILYIFVFGVSFMVVVFMCCFLAP